MSRHYWPEQDVALRWFHPREFDHPEYMDADFLEVIDEWRARCGFPIYITGDGRTEEEHQSIYAPGAPPQHSAHLKGKAVDCKLLSGPKRITMAREILLMEEEGLVSHLGLEIATHHIHIENYDHPQFQRPTIWSGVSR